MRPMPSRVSGTSTEKGDSAFFFGIHSIFAILEPSGKGLPLPGTPARQASIIAGLATIHLIFSSVLLTATGCQFSYPLKSENASPPGTCTVYLSCAARAMPPETASDATMVITGMFLFFISVPLFFAGRRRDFDQSIGLGVDARTPL